MKGKMKAREWPAYEPVWLNLDGDGLGLVRACWAAPFGEQLPWLVLADWLTEREDPREFLVRRLVRWERVAREVRKFTHRECQGWESPRLRDALDVSAEPKWRRVVLYLALAARHVPGKDGMPFHKSWASHPSWVMNRFSVFWSVGLVRAYRDDLTAMTRRQTVPDLPPVQDTAAWKAWNDENGIDATNRSLLHHLDWCGLTRVLHRHTLSAVNHVSGSLRRNWLCGLFNTLDRDRHPDPPDP